ncbi:MAG: DUF805 domain-containing protein [Spirosomataceae bacterium]
MFNYYLEVLKKYATFTGRSRRSEYWYYTLVTTIISAALGIFGDFGTYLSIVYALATFIPGIAVSVRRLHDIGKTGKYIFVILIPFIGAVWLLILFCEDSQYGPNKYGANPKGLGNFESDDNLIQSIGQ